MILFSTLRRLFFGKPNVIQTREGIRRLPFRSSAPHWIVGRGLCMYRCEDFTSIPRSRRRRALDFKLPVWSPFERTGYHAVWCDGVAMVWFWTATGSLRRPATSRRCFRPRAGEGSGDPEFCQRQSSTNERQPACIFSLVWKESRYNVGRLTSSLMPFGFPRPLTKVSWTGSSRGKTSTSEYCPSQHRSTGSRQHSNAARSLPASRAPRDLISASRWMLASIFLLALLLIVTWQEARFWKVHQLERDTAFEVHRLQQHLAPALKARAAFSELRQRNLALLTVLGKPSQAHLMSAVNQALPSAEAEFREWGFRDGTIKISIQDRSPDPVAYIRALEALPMFAHVRAELAPNDGRLEITLKVQE